jgi:threonylcarbamoyladenosine tRNA methylthiotransferase MtaB
MRSVGFATIGCKLNQFETEQMRETVEALGYATCGGRERADVYVINTCTVTSKSDYRSRQAIRRALRLNPEAIIIVTGCYAQLAYEDIARMEGVDVIAGNAEKESIGTYVGLDKQGNAIIDVTEADRRTAVGGQRRLHGFGQYTRAFVKIQDGCDNRCSYCAVPLARGRSRSKPQQEVTSEIETLVGAGFKEVVLTGVHLGSYGRDLSPAGSLAGLLRRITGTPGLARLRLSSIEPTDFTDELIDLIGDTDAGICPHVHVPLQSGDDRILKLMGRPYTRAFYGDLIGRIADRVPRCGIGADVMVGFPGEDGEAFDNTRRLLSDLPVTYLHVFSFSMRAGTRAPLLKGQVDPQEKKRRSHVLRELGMRKGYLFRESLVGKNLEVLTLARRVDGLVSGLSGNYVRVVLDEPTQPNTILPCRVTGVRGGGVVATAA